MKAFIWRMSCAAAGEMAHFRALLGFDCGFLEKGWDEAMAFWSKKPPQDAGPPENPFRKYDPLTFDKMR
jgi:hypothetical protein